MQRSRSALKHSSHSQASRQGWELPFLTLMGRQCPSGQPCCAAELHFVPIRNVTAVPGIVESHCASHRPHCYNFNLDICILLTACAVLSASAIEVADTITLSIDVLTRSLDALPMRLPLNDVLIRKHVQFCAARTADGRGQRCCWLACICNMLS